MSKRKLEDTDTRKQGITKFFKGASSDQEGTKTICVKSAALSPPNPARIRRDSSSGLGGRRVDVTSPKKRPNPPHLNVKKSPCTTVITVKVERDTNRPPTKSRQSDMQGAPLRANQRHATDMPHRSFPSRPLTWGREAQTSSSMHPNSSEPLRIPVNHGNSAVRPNPAAFTGRALVGRGSAPVGRGLASVGRGPSSVGRGSGPPARGSGPPVRLSGPPGRGSGPPVGGSGSPLRGPGPPRFRGSVPSGRGLVQVRRGSGPTGRGFDSPGRGGAAVGRSPVPLARGPAPPGRGPVPLMGRGSASPSRGSVTPGRGSVTPGRGSVTPGRGSVTPGRESVTPGRGSVTPGRGSVTPGRGSVTPGRGSVTPGRGSVTPGRGSVTPGRGSVTPGRGSVTPGRGSVTPGRGSVTPGRGSVSQPGSPLGQRTQSPGSGPAPGMGFRMYSPRGGRPSLPKGNMSGGSPQRYHSRFSGPMSPTGGSMSQPNYRSPERGPASPTSPRNSLGSPQLPRKSLGSPQPPRQTTQAPATRPISLLINADEPVEVISIKDSSSEAGTVATDDASTVIMGMDEIADTLDTVNANDTDSDADTIETLPADLDEQRSVAADNDGRPSSPGSPAASPRTPMSPVHKSPSKSPGYKSPRAGMRSPPPSQASQRSHNFSSYMDDSQILGSPINLSDSDDDELPGVDSIITRRTPSKATASQSKVIAKPVFSSDDDEYKPVSTAQNVHKAQNIQNKLDNLLADREGEVQTSLELDRMKKTLKDGLRDGGVSKYIADDSEDDLMPEHKEALKELSVHERVIKEHAPGEKVFHQTQVQRLFTHALSVSDLSFTPGESYIDKHIAASSAEQVLEMVTDDLLIMCFDSISNPSVVLRWIFHAMSVCANSLAAYGCYKTLHTVLHREEGAGSTWAPTPLDLARVLVNYGAKLTDILPTNEFGAIEIEDLVFDQEKENQEDGQMRPANLHHTGQFVEDLKYVIQTMTNAVLQRYDQYSANDIIMMCIMMFKTVLAKELIQDNLKYDQQLFFAAALNAFPEEDWPDVRHKLCRVVPALVEHHHNCVQMVSALPVVERGHELQRRLGFCMLQKLLLPEGEREIVDDLKCIDILRVLARVNIKNTPTYNFYQLASIVKLTDQAVGNENLKVEEKANFKALSDKIRNFTGAVKELPNYPDRTMVKDIMVRLSSKWCFMQQNMGSVQRSIFGFTHSSGPTSQTIEQVMQDENLSDSDDTEHEDLDGSATDDENDEDMLLEDTDGKVVVSRGTTSDQERDDGGDPESGVVAQVKDVEMEDDDMLEIKKSLEALEPLHDGGDSDSDLPEI